MYTCTIDLDKNGWRPRKDITMATSVQSNQGDYRRVSKEVWDKFAETYPGKLTGKHLHLYRLLRCKYIYQIPK